MKTFIDLVYKYIFKNIFEYYNYYKLTRLVKMILTYTKYKVMINSWTSHMSGKASDRATYYQQLYSIYYWMQQYERVKYKLKEWYIVDSIIWLLWRHSDNDRNRKKVEKYFTQFEKLTIDKGLIISDSKIKVMKIGKITGSQHNRKMRLRVKNSEYNLKVVTK